MRDRRTDRHRAVGTAVAGHALGPDDIIHHKDENKANNHPSNLVVVPRGQHTTEHNKARPLSKLRKALRGETKVY
jgi:hypothetical protein